MVHPLHSRELLAYQRHNYATKDIVQSTMLLFSNSVNHSIDLCIRSIMVALRINYDTPPWNTRYKTRVLILRGLDTVVLRIADNGNAT